MPQHDERRHFTVTFDPELFERVKAYQIQLGHPTMVDAVRDLVRQSLSATPEIGALQAAHYRGVYDVHRAIIPRYVELTRKILGELEESHRTFGATTPSGG